MIDVKIDWTDIDVLITDIMYGLSNFTIEMSINWQIDIRQYGK